MKKLFGKFLLLFGKKHSRFQVEGCFKYRVDYKVLFGNEYILYKTLPPVHFNNEAAELPFLAANG